jgi:DNA-binding NarL/FixJ family response regulator
LIKIMVFCYSQINPCPLYYYQRVEFPPEVLEMKIKKVFIVDDDPEFRRFLKEFLSDQPGLKIVGEAADGKQALEKVKKIKPDLVLLDIRMPGMDGFSASRLLKRIMPDLQIIIMTIFDDLEYKESVVENGAFGYVVKSNLTRDLMPAIRAALKNENKAQKHKNEK